MAFCERCGRASDAAHEECRRLLALEAPRFCPRCGRRLRVQVYPDRVDARCAEHGPLTDER